MGTLVIALIVVAVFAIIYALVFVMRRQQRVAMLRVARADSGHMVDLGWLRGSRVELTVANETGRLTCSTGNARWPYTRLQFDATFRDELRVHRQGSWLAKKLHKPSALDEQLRVTIGDPEFDRDFQIEGTEAFAREILTSDVRREMFGIRGQHPSLIVTGSTFTFEVPDCLPPHEERLAAFYRAAVRTFQLVRQASPPAAS